MARRDIGMRGIGMLRDRSAFLAMIIAVVTGSALPLWRSPDFYVLGNSGIQWLPAGRRIGDLLLAGDSHLMDPQLWRGGNFVAEAGFGVWNPVVLALDVTVLQLDDLLLAAWLHKAFFLVLLAVGTFALAREYGAASWPAAVAGTAVPLAGFTLWTDAAAWTPNLVSFAFVPYVWIAARRVARGVSSPVWFVVAGALCVSSGNPYTGIVVFVVAATVTVEFADLERWKEQAPLAVALGAVGLIAVFVYLPFLRTASVGFRETGVANDETLAPGLGDFLGLSSPTLTPYVRNFGQPALAYPAFYLSWFVLPLAPWLRRWSSGPADRRVRSLALFLGVFLVLAAAPSNFWFFRWPIRFVPYAFLPVAVMAALVLGRGLDRTAPVRKTAWTIGLGLVGFYLAWADVPSSFLWHLGGLVLVVGLVLATVWLSRRHDARTGVALIAGTILVLAFQLQWRPANESFRDFDLPWSAPRVAEAFDERYIGTTLSISQYSALPKEVRFSDDNVSEITVGNTAVLAGVETVGAYSGIGFVAHDSSLCIAFDGSICSEAWYRLWEPVAGGSVPLVDLMRIETIAVQRSLLDPLAEATPRGWVVAEVGDHVVRYRRLEPLAHPDSRLGGVSGPVAILATSSSGPTHESVRWAREEPGAGELTFARLNWPGYRAELDGRVLPVGGNEVGLLTVELPSTAEGGEVVLTWSPPAWRWSLVALSLGVLAAAVSHWMWRRAATVSQVRVLGGEARRGPSE